MIDKLAYLIALARERHFGRAAEACGVAQPTLSAGLKQLEEEFGVVLVNRGSRFVGFTAEGERVLDWARRIVGDTQAMREEVSALRFGHLTGHLRIAVIPTALAMVAAVTTPFRARYPGVRFTIQSRTSIQILMALENLEIDAGITYLDNEPLGHVRTVPLYDERYCLVTAADSPLGDRTEVAWSELRQLPLCLLTPDMQNRRIIDHLLGSGERDVLAPMLESDSMILLLAHVRTRQWASIVPSQLIEPLGLTDGIQVIPIVEPVARHTIGLVVSERDPMSPLAAALASEAARVAATLGDLAS